MPAKAVPPFPNGKGFGWRPEPADIRDYPLSKKMSIRMAGALPRLVDFSSKMTAVRDQGDSNSCVGFSTAAAVSYLKEIDKDPRHCEQSPLFSYYNARLLEDEQTLKWTKVDEGAYIRLAVKALSKYGIAPETKWPFNFKKVLAAPTKTAYTEGTRWKLGDYYRCEGALEVMNALSQGYPVVGGISCHSSMFADIVNKSGDIPMPRTDGSDIPMGGHAICFCGYDQEKGKIIFKNSWGKSWGNKGFGTFPVGFFGKAALVDDCWALQGELVVPKPSPIK